MALAGGTHQLGTERGQLLVHTGRSGLGAKVGHDLTIEVTRWTGSATVDVADPSRSAVSVEVAVDSFEVRHGAGGVKPLTDSDRADIEKTLREKILRTSRYPMITFRSTRVVAAAESFLVEGDLTIMDVTQPVTVRGSVVDGWARGTATVTQTRWGIKPYSTFLGALKLRDDVDVEFNLDFT